MPVAGGEPPGGGARSPGDAPLIGPLCAAGTRPPLWNVSVHSRPCGGEGGGSERRESRIRGQQFSFVCLFRKVFGK